MNEKAASIIQKAQQERKRAQFDRALKRLEQGIAAHPEVLDLYLEAIDTAIEGGELLAATNHLKTVQDKFSKERERVQQFVREKLRTVHDPSLARCAVEHAVKRRDLEAALELLADVPDHTIRELLNRAQKKSQSLKSAAGSGYALRGENVVNELTNAILSVRVGNLKEAMATFVGLVEEKPVEHKALDPFLAALAPKHPKAGRIRHARGIVMRANGNEIEAIKLFVEASQLEPACAASCIEQLEAMLPTAHHPGKVRRALAEVQLSKGDLDDATRTLRDYLADNPDNSREVIMLLRPFIAPADEINSCTWLALELALGLETPALVLELMRPLAARGHSAELFTWMEEHPLPLPPAELTLFHASLALDAKDYSRAADMLGDVCDASPADVTAVLSLIERHRDDIEIEALYLKHSIKKETRVEPSSTNEAEFHNFEPGEFQLETSARGPAPAAPSAPTAGPQAKPKPRFNSSPFSNGKNESTKNDSEESFIDRGELSFDDDGSVHRDEEAPAEPMFSSTIEITEEHVTNVAQKLYETGAAAFFHIDGDASASTTETVSEEPSVDAVVEEKVETPAAPEAAPAPTTETFAQRYARFSRGELPNNAVLVLLEEAVEDGRADELHDLLGFEPETGEEHFARYYYQAEYHIMSNRPLQALEILAKLDTPAMETVQKQRVWYKIAVAQRMTLNYTGASETLERLVEAFPGREDFARLKKRNHEQSIEAQSCAALTLEKTSSLD